MNKKKACTKEDGGKMMYLWHRGESDNEMTGEDKEKLEEQTKKENRVQHLFSLKAWF